MRTIAILPIKSFGAAKQRLAGMLASGARQALVQAMFQDTLAALRHVEGLDAIVVVTANTTAQQAARGEGVELLNDEMEAGHCEAALLGVRHALDGGYERVLLVPGDTPLLDPVEVDELLLDANGLAVVVVPDRHGTGTNALLLSPPDGIAPAFGPDSCARHQAVAAAAACSCTVAQVPSLALDVDTPEDLAEIAAALETRRGHASATRGALRQLGRSGAIPADALNGFALRDAAAVQAGI